LYCPRCGAKSAPNAAFCHKCGARLPGLDGTPASAETPPAAESESAGAGSLASQSSADPAQATAADNAPEAGNQSRSRELVYPPKLAAHEYAHPLDRRSLEAIAKFGPVVALTRAIMGRWDEPMVKGQLLGGTVRIGPGQFPEIHEVVARCAKILNMEEPEVFIRHHPAFNAMTLGSTKPLIILHSALVESFSTEELAYIIGHEMGHIKCEHGLYLSAANILTMGARSLIDRLFGVGYLIIRPAAQALQAWMRKAELSADRAGLLCVQDLTMSRRALIKLALGSKMLFERLDIEEYLNQADQAARDEYGRLGELMQTHPYIANRVRELRYFYDSPVYAGILGAGPAPSALQSERLAEQALERGRDHLTRVSGSVAGLLAYRSTLDRAIGEFDHVISRYPATEAARQATFYKGMAHLNRRQGLEAAKALQSFVLHNPLHELAPEALWGLALAFERLLEDREAAIAEYRKLLEEFPESARAPEAKEALRRLGAPDVEPPDLDSDMATDLGGNLGGEPW